MLASLYCLITNLLRSTRSDQTRFQALLSNLVQNKLKQTQTTQQTLKDNPTKLHLKILYQTFTDQLCQTNDAYLTVLIIDLLKELTTGLKISRQITQLSVDCLRKGCVLPRWSPISLIRFPIKSNFLSASSNLQHRWPRSCADQLCEFLIVFC